MFDQKTTIETERLIIRAFFESDKRNLFDIMKEKEMTLYTPDDPWQSLEDAQEFLDLVFRLYQSNHTTFKYFLAITLKVSHELIGICGIGGIEFDRHQNEIFYHIGRKWWGMGYASEAAESILKYGFETLQLNTIIGVVHCENIASKRIMEKIGMKSNGKLSNFSKEFDYFNGSNWYSIDKEHNKNN